MSSTNTMVEKEFDVRPIFYDPPFKGTCVCGKPEVWMRAWESTHLARWRCSNGKEIVARKVGVGCECFESIRIVELLE